jgi:hypothetical protein
VCIETGSGIATASLSFVYKLRATCVDHLLTGSLAKLLAPQATENIISRHGSRCNSWTRPAAVLRFCSRTLWISIVADLETFEPSRRGLVATDPVARFETLVEFQTYSPTPAESEPQNEHTSRQHIRGAVAAEGGQQVNVSAG